MHVKFFPTGKGGGKGPTKYLTDEAIYKDGELIVRDPLPEVLRGDVSITRSLIDSSKNEWKYTSGVIAFHADDSPTEAQQQQVMDDFERLAFAGLEPDQYNILWVRHTHEGNVELHMVTPRLELESGKALNIAPPGHSAAFDSLRDAWNYEQGWARPDDPARQKLLSQNEKQRSPQLTERKKAREEITDWLMQRVESGLIKDRDDVLESLKEIGQITRAGKDYISVKPEGFTQAIKLKGALYDEKFSAEAVRNLAAEIGSRQSENPEFAARAAREAREELERHVRARSEYNSKRYSGRDNAPEQAHRAVSQEHETTADYHAGRDPEQASSLDSSAGLKHESSSDKPPLVMVKSDSTEPSSLSSHLERELGADALVDEQSNQLKSGNNPEPADAGELAYRGQFLERQQRTIPHDEKRTRTLQDQIGRLGSEIKQIIKVGYDRVRDKIDSVITSLRDRIEAARESFSRASEQLANNSKQLATTAGQFDTSTRTIEQTATDSHESIQRNKPVFNRGIAAMRGNRTDEIQRFKTDINLSDYAAEQGYVLIKNESSRNSFVMQRESDNDKIIVATDTDGHGIYFSVRDDADNGSIIDFVQQRKGLNLGQVRQELRPYIGENREQKPIESRMSKPQISTHDAQKAAVNWSRAQPAPEHDYLEKRGITKATLQDPRFAPVVRTDERNNALFAHYNKQGISGYEIKNKDFTGFAAGGQKGLWFTSNINHAERIIITETAIDALSHAEFQRRNKANEPEKTAYVSFGGSMSPEQKELISSMLKKMQQRSQKLVLANDRDEAGEAFNEQINGLAPVGLETSLEQPLVNTKDWNESLLQQMHVDQVHKSILDRTNDRRHSPDHGHGMPM